MPLFGVVKERLAFTVAVVVAGGITVWLIGQAALAGVVAIVAGLLVAARMRLREPDGGPVMPSERRGLAEPFAWTIAAPASLSLSEAVQRLQAIGLGLDRQDGAGARLSGGSELRTRLWGGYFVEPDELPIAVGLRAARGPGSALEARVQDAIGLVAVRDRGLERRYALRVSEIHDALNGGQGSEGRATGERRRSGGLLAGPSA